MSMRFIAAAMGSLAALALPGPAHGAPPTQTLEARATERPIILDGAIDDWAGVRGITVPLSGEGVPIACS